MKCVAVGVTPKGAAGRVPYALFESAMALSGSDITTPAAVCIFCRHEAAESLTPDMLAGGHYSGRPKTSIAAPR